MVSLAFVLFTVSTLASLTNAFPREPVVRHECGNKTFCHIKPVGYPQEEIDRLALKHLPQLRRMRRNIVKASDPEYGGNCYPVRTEVPVYTMRENNGPPRYLVNSEWFVQNITEVECVENQKVNSACFKEYLVSNDIQTKCETRKVQVELLVYTPGSEGLQRAKTEIGADCACVINKS